MTKFIVSDNVPLPASGVVTPAYPWSEMNVGDSFFVPGKKQISIDAPSKRHGYSFTTRRVTEGGVYGVRVWRTK